jgi:hypothetical protein
VGDDWEGTQSEADCGNINIDIDIDTDFDHK